MLVPHTSQLQSATGVDVLTLDGGDLVWTATADTILAPHPRVQGSAGYAGTRLAEGGGLPTKVRRRLVELQGISRSGCMHGELCLLAGPGCTIACLAGTSHVGAKL